MDDFNDPALEKLPWLKGQLGVRSSATIYGKVEAGLLPPPVKDGHASFWPKGEVRRIVAAITAGLSEEEQRALVARMVAARKAAAAALCEA